MNELDKYNDMMKKLNDKYSSYEEPRLLLITKENKNLLLIGEIDNDVCKFRIPELKMYEKGDYGKIKFEIISEDLYFPVWQDNFEIKSKASIKIEEMISEIQQNSAQQKPKISVSEAKIEPVFEKKSDKVEPKTELKFEKKNELETNETLSKLDAIFQKSVPIIEEDEEIESVKDVKKQSPIIRFDSFK